MRRSNTVKSLTHLALALLLPTAACSKGEAEAKLPPARGPGAAPMPALPSIEADPGAGAISATEGETTGTTVAHQEAQLGPVGSGVIAAVAVEEGARVKKGQLLFSLDPRDSELRLQAAKAAHAAAEVNLRATKVEFDRTKQLLDQNAINRAQWDQMEARYDAAKIGVEQARIAVDMSQKALEDAAVRAPFDGVVTAKLKSVGELATMMPPTIVVVLQQHSVLDVEFRLPERALATVKTGDAVSVSFSSLGVTRSAKIVRVLPNVDPRTRTVGVVAELPNADLFLKPGLLASVKLGEAHAAAERAP